MNTPINPAPDTITHCAACHQPFKGREKWTLAAWFKCGPVRLSDIVHVRCAFVRRPQKKTEGAENGNDTPRSRGRRGASP